LAFGVGLDKFEASVGVQGRPNVESECPVWHELAHNNQLVQEDLKRGKRRNGK